MPPLTTDRDDGTTRNQHQQYDDDSNRKSYAMGQSTPSSNPINFQSESSPKERAIPIPFLDRLRALPELRSIPWRAGQELPSDKSTDSPRVQQRGACLLATRGKVVEKPCNHCTAGLGRFSACIALENWFQGACSTCIFTSKGNRCSLRIEVLGNADARTLRYTSARPEMEESPVFYESEERESSRKRKRLSAPPQVQSTVSSSYTSPYPPISSLRSLAGKFMIANPPMDPQPPAQDLDTLLQAEIARNEPSTLVEYGYEEKREEKNQRNPQWQQYAIQGVEEEKPHEWPRTQQKEQAIRSLLPDATESKSQPKGNNAQTRLPLVSHGPALPLIDTLPRTKQRQIYGAVSGLQAGIGNLQRELTFLQDALGIDFEESGSSG